MGPDPRRWPDPIPRPACRIYFFPHSLPSKPAVILTHHVVTMGLLGFAWCYPEFAKWVCVDGLTEINTW